MRNLSQKLIFEGHRCVASQNNIMSCFWHTTTVYKSENNSERHWQGRKITPSLKCWPHLNSRTSLVVTKRNWNPDSEWNLCNKEQWRLHKTTKLMHFAIWTFTLCIAVPLPTPRLGYDWTNGAVNGLFLCCCSCYYTWSIPKYLSIQIIIPRKKLTTTTGHIKFFMENGTGWFGYSLPFIMAINCTAGHVDSSINRFWK